MAGQTKGCGDVTDMELFNVAPYTGRLKPRQSSGSISREWSAECLEHGNWTRQDICVSQHVRALMSAMTRRIEAFTSGFLYLFRIPRIWRSIPCHSLDMLRKVRDTRTPHNDIAKHRACFRIQRGDQLEWLCK